MTVILSEITPSALRTGKRVGKSRMGFKTLVLNEYSPGQVAQITGIPEETIVQIAQEFSSHRPSIAISGRGMAMQTNGTYAQMAIDSLNALVGSIDSPGRAPSSEKTSVSTMASG